MHTKSMSKNEQLMNQGGILILSVIIIVFQGCAWAHIYFVQCLFWLSQTNEQALCRMLTAGMKITEPQNWLEITIFFAVVWGDCR